MKIGLVSYLVRDYDEAIGWFTGKLCFSLVEDIALSPAKRWVVVAPPSGGTNLLLARADGAAQEAAIGAQAGGRVFSFLYTDDFARDHSSMTAKGVKFLEAPRREPYGIVAVFEDLYGQKWDLIEPSTS
jgi:catechol 2,3-dioxygenase-like lactoylglutathione lyase family enzyme